jgi:hypothetical protein
MKRVQLVQMAAAVVAFYAVNACSGDADKPATNAGSSGKGSGAAASGGSSAGTGTAGTPTAGTSGSVTTEQCLTSHFSDPAITSTCKDCMCQCNAAAAAACDANCWSLARCIQVDCAGNMADINCATTKCAAFIAGGGAALQATQCLTQCGPSACQDWFVAAPGGGGSGAGGDAGGAASGAAGGGTDAAGMSNQGGAGGDGP